MKISRTANTAPAPTGVRPAALLLGALATLLVAVLCLVPSTAFALDIAKCTAKPNADSGSDVLGGIVTRVTWEGQCDPDESLAGLALTFPDGATYSIEDARITMLTGDDLMTRTNIEAEYVADGQTLRAAFSEPALAGGYFRIEVYDVVFPTRGGEMQLTGAYTLADGAEQQMGEIPIITVAGVDAFSKFARDLEQQQWVKDWTQNKFCHLFLNPPIFVRSLPVVAQGFLMALGILAVAFPLAIPFGLLLALMRMAKFPPFRGIASLYVNVVRGTPLFLQIYIAFFGLPLAGIKVAPFVLGVVVLAMNSSAYLCEIFRAGIQSIHKGQFEASRSLGMNGAQTMLFVIIPQTVRRVIPTMMSEFILLYKDTSLLAAVGVMEVVMYAKTIVAATGSITPYIVAACFYLVVTLPLAKIVGKLEAKLAGNDSGASSRKKRKKGAGGIAAAAAPDALPGREDEGTRRIITPEQMSSL